MTFDEAMVHYAPQLKYSAITVAQGNPATVDELKQEARMWLWENIETVSRWSQGDDAVSRDKVYASLRRRLVDYVHAEGSAVKDIVFASERAAQLSSGTTGRMHGDGITEDQIFTEPLVSERGLEATFPASGDLTEYLLRCVAAEFDKLDAAKRDLLIDVYVKKQTLSAAANARSVGVTYIGRECRKYVQEALARAQETVGAHVAIPVNPPASRTLHSCAEGFGGRA